MKLQSSVALPDVTLPAVAAPVSLTVVGPDDRPLLAARVSVLEMQGEAAREITADKPVGTNGTFAFEWNGEFGETDVIFNERRVLAVRVEAPDMTVQTRYLRAPAMTLQLQRGRSWSGVVWDESGVPLAGVPVVVQKWRVPSSQNDDEHTGFFNGQPPFWVWRSITDANGRWQLDGLPARARVTLALDDARFVRKSWELLLTEAQAPPLIARTGAILTGQIVTPDGAPIVGIPVFNGGRPTDDAVLTDARGRFTLSGVAPGATTLYTRQTRYSSVLPEFLISPRTEVQAKAGETTDIGQWRAETGRTVRFLAVDAATQKPIADATFESWGGAVATIAEENGQFALRLTSNNESDDMAALGTVDAPGWIRARVALSDEQKRAETVDLGRIELKRGVALQGVVKIEGETSKSRELPVIMLFKGDNRKARGYISAWRSEREFSTPALEAGDYKIEVDDIGWSVAREWQIVSPQTVTVPAPDGDKPPAIEIVLKRLTPTPMLREVRGQLLDARGAAVAGAVVEMRLTGGSYESRTAISDAQGNFVADGAMGATTVQIRSVARAGYLLRGDARVAIADEVATVSGLTLKKRGGIFAGRVLDESGAPVENAWVAMLGAPKLEPLQTRADGRFELTDLPLQNFALIAAKDDRFARIETDEDAADVELRLRSAPPVDREALAEEALRVETSWHELRDYITILGRERAAQIMERQPKLQSHDMSLFALEMVAHDPTLFVRLAPAWLPRLEGREKTRIEMELMRLRAQNGSADEKTEVNDWLGARKAEKRAIDAQSVTQLLDMAVMARALGREDADELLDYAAAIKDQLGKSTPDQTFFWGVSLSHLGYESLARFAESPKPATEFETLLISTYALALNGDFESANRAIERAEALAQTPTMRENLPDEEHQRPASHMNDLRQQLALFQAPTDPVGAFEQVERVAKSWQRTPALLVIADGAIAKGDLPLAERALRMAQTEAAMSNSGSDKIWPLMASLGAQVSPQLGTELWQAATDRLRGNSRFGTSNRSPETVWWAFYHAPLDMGQSRVALEREWGALLPAAIENRDEEHAGEADQLRDIAAAMAVIDAARAMEMQSQLLQIGGANVSLGAALLATPAQRTLFGVDSLK